MPRPADLPDYDRPPIDEVVMGVQLSPVLEGFTEAHVGLYWQTVKSSYPTAQSQPRMETPPEDLEGPQRMAVPTFQLSLGGHQQGRTWLVSKDESVLLQIQNNRFLRNWRKRGGKYPHFDQLSTDFLRDYKGFCAVMKAEHLPAPQIEQVELSYVNWIPDLKMAEFFLPATASHLKADGLDGPPEDQTWNARYLLTDDQKKRIGRLYVQCNPAMRIDDEAASPTQGTQLALVFRAPSRGHFEDEALRQLLILGRQAIVKAFTQLTTADAHESWGRTQ